MRLTLVINKSTDSPYSPPCAMRWDQYGQLNICRPLCTILCRRVKIVETQSAPGITVFELALQSLAIIAVRKPASGDGDGVATSRVMSGGRIDSPLRCDQFGP
jgi:hypothetical protein